jgi:O-antigen ligase
MTTPAFPVPRAPARPKQAATARLRATARRAALQAARDPMRTGLFLLIVVTISRIHLQFKPLAALRPALVLTLFCMAAAWLKPHLLSRAPLTGTTPAKLMLGIAGLAVFSALFGISLGGSAKFMLDSYWKTLVLAFLIIAAVRGPRDLYTLVWAFVISVLILSYTSLFVFKVQHYQGYDRLANLNTYDANDLGLVLVYGIGLALLTFHSSRGAGRIVSGITIIGCAAGIAKSGSRGAFLGLLMLGIALLFLAKGVSAGKKLMIILAAAAGLSVFAPAGYWHQMQTILHPEQDYNWNTVNGRRQVFERGLGYIEQYPLFGLGIGNFGKAECTISERAKEYGGSGPIRCMPPHNAYLESAAEVGIVGGILFVALIPGSIFMLLRMRRRMPRRWATGDAEERFLAAAPTYFAVGVAGFSLGASLLSFAWTDVTYFIAAINAGLIVAVRVKMNQEAAARGQAVPAHGVSRVARGSVRARVRRL